VKYRLKPYPRMKDLGESWMGQVPENWELRKLRSVLKNVSKRNRPDLPLLSVVCEKGVILRDISSKDVNHNFIPDDLSNYKVVRSGQFAMNKMKAWQGSYGVSEHDGIVSPAYFVFEISRVNSNFFHTAIRSKAYVPLFTQASDGVRIGQWDLSQTRMQEITFRIPPIQVQTSIVHFLDYIDLHIQRYIQTKTKLILLLEEYKHAIINQAVTKGLDPNVKMKPSGIDWLEEIPVHWEVTRLSRIALGIGDGLHGTPEYVPSSDYYFINGNNLADGEIVISLSTQCVAQSASANQGIELNGSSLLMSINGTIGNLAFYRGESVMLGKSAAYINCSKRLHRDYLFRFLQSKFAREYYTLESTGTTILNLSLKALRDIPIVLLPLVEQENIAKRLEDDCGRVKHMIDCQSDSIRLALEYRTRLISDVVTGKADVRNIAAQLSEDDDKEELLEEVKRKSVT